MRRRVAWIPLIAKLCRDRVFAVSAPRKAAPFSKYLGELGYNRIPVYPLPIVVLG